MLVDRAVAVAAARVAQLLADAALEETLAAFAAHHAVVTTCACAVMVICDEHKPIAIADQMYYMYV